MADGKPFSFADTTFLRWLGVAGAVGTLLLFVMLGWTAMQYGGVPHAYHRYGIVAVPGRQTLELPAGRVMLDHADDVDGCWDNTNHIKNASIYGAPQGLAVRITPLNGGSPLVVTRVPAWLYMGITNCRGHEPFGRIDTPAAGRYLVETTDSAHGGFTGPPQIRGSMTPKSTHGPGIAFGPRPWAPFGSPLLAGVAVVAFALAASALMGAAGMLIWGDGPFRTRLRALAHPRRLLSRMLRG
jgi:hypothetical protein